MTKVSLPDPSEAARQVREVRDDLTAAKRIGSRSSIRVPETPGLGLDMLVGAAVLGYSLVLYDPEDPEGCPRLERRGQHGLAFLPFFIPQAIKEPTYPGFGLLPTSTSPTLASAVWDALHRAMDSRGEAASRLREEKPEGNHSPFGIARAIVSTWREFDLPDVSGDPAIQERLKATERAIADGWLKMKRASIEQRGASLKYKDDY